MNLKSVDGSESTNIDGYSYTNNFGVQEYVYVPSRHDVVRIVTFDAGYEEVANVHREDIPKLIKALQAVYAHKE